MIMCPSASGTHIFQFYCSNATREALDPGFEPLGNTRNERCDWREYWPIAALDALKIAYQVEPLQQYLRAYFELRARFAAMANKR